MIKIGKSTDHISVYTCQPSTNNELRNIIDERISKEGPNCDLNDIDTSLIYDMSWIFSMRDFNGDISKWDVSNAENMSHMFYGTNFDGDILRWDVSKVTDMSCMFYWSRFNQDISKWNIRKDCNTNDMFKKCPIEDRNKPRN